jgi:DNA-binding NarL/FixJ family response regulator
MQTTEIKVYFIDDHPLIIEGLKSEFILNDSRLSLIGHANRIKPALLEITRSKPDIIILDLYLHRDDPVSNFRCLKKIFPNIPIVIYSAEERLYWKSKMIEEGAAAYLTKTEQPTIVDETLLEVYYGKIVIPADVLKWNRIKSQIVDGKSYTQSELEVVQLLSSGLAIFQIGIFLGKCRYSIDKTLSKLRKRLNVRSNAELVHSLTLMGEI